ncbi:hypothetical protein BRCON_1750 [Candidatus Sumerlaea chitinivorans]|uniref:Uncharacterized protein n=1 Tax=Sumerlaea chitinivorans TaxID=2250252 RepID=A0A2Z4Y5N5_SUMC1|nr:hypothetical protein BRCON_1750 [Candidatus Sumerlaea chitinivorans]
MGRGWEIWIGSQGEYVVFSFIWFGKSYAKVAFQKRNPSI